ncbi:hypothetical protein BH09PAT3_BH09PAT3_3360 [soil metagenome]
MKNNEHKKRLVQNEAVFRKWNESIHGLDKDNKATSSFNPSQKSKFLCECADENCAETITLNYEDYGNIHKKRDEFVIIPGHEVALVESVVLERPSYLVVRKMHEPTEDPGQLQPTLVNNA